jgi:hypothetical protein
MRGWGRVFRKHLEWRQREEFENLLREAEHHRSAGMTACRTLIFEAFAVCILLHRQRELEQPQLGISASHESKKPHARNAS